jgi:hypothetical protein
MRNRGTAKALRLLAVAILVTLSTVFAYPKQHKDHEENKDDLTNQLFQLLDNSYGGKLANFCLVADVYTDPSQPGLPLQHVLQVDYDKTRYWGRLRIYVRSVSQLSPEQLKEYTPEQLYGFGSDDAKFEKINAGPFGETGDAYFRTSAAGPLAAVPITDEAKQQYEFFLTQQILPALQRKASVHSLAAGFTK